MKNEKGIALIGLLLVVIIITIVIFFGMKYLKEYVSNQPSYLFRPKAVYRLDNTILELE